jgi:hypothetical protein
MTRAAESPFRGDPRGDHADDDRIVRVAQAFSPANYFGRAVNAAILPIATKIPCNKACGLGGHPGT